MAKNIKNEAEKTLDSKNPRDREIFREKLIGKLKSNRVIKKLTPTQQDELIAKLSGIRFSFSTSKTNNSSRRDKLLTVSKAAKKLVKLIEDLDDSEQCILDDEWQHTICLSKRIEIIRSFETNTNLLASRIPITGTNRSAKIIQYFNGQSLYDVLNSFSIPATSCKETSNDKENTILNVEVKANHSYLPDLSINATTAMLCAMLSLMDGEIENLNWAQTITIIDSAKRARDFKENLDKAVKSDNLREKLNSLIEDIINNPH